MMVTELFSCHLHQLITLNGIPAISEIHMILKLHFTINTIKKAFICGVYRMLFAQH